MDNFPSMDKLNHYLDEMKLLYLQIMHRFCVLWEIGEQGEKIQIGYVVVAHRLAEGGKAAVAPEEIHPDAEKVLVVQGLIIQAEGPEGEGQGQHGGGKEYKEGSVQNPAAV